MTEPSSASDLLKLALVLAKSSATRRMASSWGALCRGALLLLFAASCGVAALVLALVAVWIGIAPVFGPAEATAIDAGALALIGLGAFGWARRRSTRPSPESAAPLAPELALASFVDLLKPKKGLLIAAGLLAGLYAGRSTR